MNKPAPNIVRIDSAYGDQRYRENTEKPCQEFGTILTHY